MEGTPGLHRQHQRPALKAELVFGPDAIARLREDWDKLYLCADRPFLSQSFDWNWCAWQAYAMPQGARPCCATVREEGRLRLVWPLAIRRHRGLWSVATAPAPSECTDPLVEPCEDAGDLAEAACDRIWAECGADLIYIDFLRADTPVHAALRRRRPHWARALESFAAEWEGCPGWDGYYASLGKGIRRKFETGQKRLSEAGELRFEVVECQSERDRMVRWILEQKARWLDGKSRRSDFVGARAYEDLLLAASRAVWPLGSVAIFRLSLGGEPVAAEYHLLNEHRLDYILGTYLKECERLTPGHVLRRHVLKWAHDRGIAYNFGPGRDRYKEALSNRVTPFADLRFANSLRGRLFVLLKQGTAMLRPGKGEPAEE